MLFLRCDVLDLVGCCRSALAAVPLSATESLRCLLGDDELDEARRVVFVAAPREPETVPETVARLLGGLRLRLVPRPAAPLEVLVRVRVPVRVLVAVRLVRSTPVLEVTFEDIAVGLGGLPDGKEQRG